MINKPLSVFQAFGSIMSDTGKSNNKKVLGEEWFPVGEVTVECLRERVPGIDYPPTNRIHVWFARRPLVASRAAILLSIVPPNTDKQFIFDLLGMPLNRDMVGAYQTLLRAKAEKRKIPNPCNWTQAY